MFYVLMWVFWTSSLAVGITLALLASSWVYIRMQRSADRKYAADVQVARQAFLDNLQNQIKDAERIGLLETDGAAKGSTSIN